MTTSVIKLLKQYRLKAQLKLKKVISHWLSRGKDGARTVMRLPKFLRCMNNQIFSPMVLRLQTLPQEGTTQYPSHSRTPKESTSLLLSFEWSQLTISSTHSKVGVILYSIMNMRTGKYCLLAFIVWSHQVGNKVALLVLYMARKCMCTLLFEMT